MKATLFLTLLLIIISCKKDEPIKSYLSETPVLKGFYLRDANGLLMQNKNAIESGVIMQLVDISGKTIATKTGKSMRQTFDLSILSRGVYFVKVFTENGQLVGERKILKE
ncbi:hypothetical protein CW751_00550 [Brumimicrobium salinarum]|uniref:Secretion system C-terminal sorting domain-containing protein n=1 Tax=Brumimicrobium salinarum TaxID=2058658 RepID=A0A2I0R5K3_9FLAO|nr:T9SS type A sorting domain-containing protein [Brumimicrobium salinarum]PKR81861.1 hypothetical protein CW751_00550 [Brumimicrobium salinarum]